MGVAFNVSRDAGLTANSSFLERFLDLCPSVAEVMAQFGFGQILIAHQNRLIDGRMSLIIYAVSLD